MTDRDYVDSGESLAGWDRDHAGEPMTADELRAMLKADRRAACLLIAEAKVEGWMEDGPDEVARCLTVWMDRGFDLGDDDWLVELAENAGLVPEV